MTCTCGQFGKIPDIWVETHVIQEGTDWYELRQATYDESPVTGKWPRMGQGYSATYTIYPDGDATVAPVVSLSSGAGITLSNISGLLNGNTTLASGHSSGVTQVSVTSAANMKVGDSLAWLMTGTDWMHVATITQIVGTTITFDKPTVGSASGGAAIQSFDSRYFVHNIEIALTHAQTSALTDWGVGLFQLDLIDAFGHVQRIAEGRAVLTRGRDH